MKTIIEGGHFYMSKGFNHLAHKGWVHAITQLNGSKTDSVMTFIDDVHPLENMSEIEQASDTIPARLDINRLRGDMSRRIIELVDTINASVHPDVESVILNPHYIEIESGVKVEAEYALEELAKLPKKKKARQSGSGSWFCSDARLTHEDGVTPTCTGYDLGLTLKKSNLGYQRAVNILPISYEQQQNNLRRLVAKLLGDKIELVSVLYDENGDIVGEYT